MRKPARVLAALGTTATLALAPIALATPASAQQSGLVNVNVEDNEILNENNIAIGVAANIAATVCAGNVQVGVIAQQVARTGEFVCNTAADAEDQLTITQAQ